MFENQTRNDLKTFLHSALVALLAGSPLVVPAIQVALRPGTMTFEPGPPEQRAQQPPGVQYAMRPADPKLRGGADGTYNRQDEPTTEC
jgi:hypothetical protein